MNIEDIIREHTANDRESFAKLAVEFEDVRGELKDVRTDLKDATGQLTEIKLLLQKQKGFLAGVVFVVSAVAGAIALAIAWIKSS